MTRNARMTFLLAVIIGLISAVIITEIAAPSRVAARGSIGTAMVGGNVSYADPGLGRHYLAMRLPRGTRVRVCGPGDCLNLTVTDYGPSVKIRPTRIADLSYLDWLAVCGETDHEAGLCKASAEVLESVELPATDTE